MHGIDSVLLGSPKDVLLDWQWQSMGPLTDVQALVKALQSLLFTPVEDRSFSCCTSQAQSDCELWSCLITEEVLLQCFFDAQVSPIAPVPIMGVTCPIIMLRKAHPGFPKLSA